MVDYRTRVDENKLEKWASRIPVCREFLEVFFVSCTDQDPVTNFTNYVHDLISYDSFCPDKCFGKAIRKNFPRLLTAFEEITGLRVYFDMPIKKWKVARGGFEPPV